MRRCSVVESNAGRSARAEAARRRAAHVEAVENRFGRFTRIGLAFNPVPMATKNWAKGAAAEVEVGRMLDSLPGVRVVHDRIEPGRQRANIDHIVVTTSGILVVDTKSYRGRIDVSARALKIDGRDRTRLVLAVQHQVAALSQFVSGRVPVEGCLCFLGGNFSLIGPTRCQGVQVIGVRGLARHVKKRSNIRAIDVESVGDWLDSNLRIA